jgi:choline dehydrogenase
MYYQPNAGRKNLTVLCNARVSKLTLKKEGDRVIATGVNFTCDGETHTVNIEREVVLCAG